MEKCFINLTVLGTELSSKLNTI